MFVDLRYQVIAAAGCPVGCIDVRNRQLLYSEAWLSAWIPAGGYGRPSASRYLPGVFPGRSV